MWKILLLEYLPNRHSCYRDRGTSSSDVTFYFLSRSLHYIWKTTWLFLVSYWTSSTTVMLSISCILWMNCTLRSSNDLMQHSDFTAPKTFWKYLLHIHCSQSEFVLFFFSLNAVKQSSESFLFCSTFLLRNVLKKNILLWYKSISIK